MKKTFDELFSDQLKKRLTKSTILSSLIVQSIESTCDLSLTEENMEYVYEKVLKALEVQEKTGANKLIIDLKIDSEVDCEPEIPEFTEEDFENFINNEATILYQESVDWLVDKWLASIRQNEELVTQDHAAHEKFSEFLKEVWSEALDCLYLFLQTGLRFGTMYIDEHVAKSENNDEALFEVLTRLHARACQIGFEIHSLLSNGFADGAVARWRTLYEVCIIAHFISDRGNEVAERYLEYQHIDKYEELRRYQEYSNKTSWHPSDIKDLEEAFEQYTKKKKELEEKYGKAFGRSYGWAATDELKKPSFANIEKLCNLERFRPNYKIASNFVHGGSIASYESFGREHSEHDILVDGPSIYGLGVPGRNAAQSIFHISLLLLGYAPSLSSNSYIRVIKELSDEVYKAFNNCEQRMDEKLQQNDLSEDRDKFE